jgi:hypothetical protein
MSVTTKAIATCDALEHAALERLLHLLVSNAVAIPRAGLN